MHALVLAAGKGQRLEDATLRQNKCMLEYRSRPILEHILERLSSLYFVDDIVLVVGHCAEAIIDHFGNRYDGKRIRYVIQREQRGLVHAIECARDRLTGPEFLLHLGDEIMTAPRYEEFYDWYRDRQLHACLGAVRVADRERIKNTYTFLYDESRRVARLIEKPVLPLNDLMGTGNVIFGSQVFEYIDLTMPNPIRGEKELPELLQTMIDHGRTVGFFELCEQYANVNTALDVTLLESAEFARS